VNVEILGKDDVESLKQAMSGLAGNAKTYAKEGTKAVAEAVQAVGEANLKDRAGGGRYSREVATVVTVEDDSSWSTVLITPWLGMEFGGYVTFLWGHKMGSSWQGLEPMWAPFHRSSAKGYIIGAAWSELDRGKADDALAEAMLLGIDIEMDQAGVPKA
jgi:hypothetical protein